MIVRPMRVSDEIAKRLLTVELTLESRLRSRLRRSANSGAVIKLLLRFCTIMLVNSTSSSFSRQSAIVRYMRSALKVTHSWRMIRLPRVSNSRRSVQNSFRRLTMKEVKYESSLFFDICDSSKRSRVTTASEGSDSVLRSAGKVPSSTVRIYPNYQYISRLNCFPRHTFPGAILCSMINQAIAATLVASCSFRNCKVKAFTAA
jgi:hypothetical protein